MVRNSLCKTTLKQETPSAHLQQLCRYIKRPAIVNERLKRNRTGPLVLQQRSPRYRLPGPRPSVA
ncbi:MAG: hypothetical protein FJ145_23365 [Deltaproteobacteria bacterium]|nr:hypothetical protein [Deltaproteobacteria bacterium]